MAINISDEELKKVTGASLNIDMTEMRHQMERDYAMMIDDCDAFIKLKGYKEAKSLYQIFVIFHDDIPNEIHEKFKD